jgi:hypothetical protein
MRELERLPTLDAPAALKERTLRQALKAQRHPVPRMLSDLLLVAFCVGHLGWCLRVVWG